MHWFRFYSDVINDPKVQLLPTPLRWRWVELLCLASKGGGILPSVEHMAFALRASINDMQSDVDRLIDATLIDITPDGRLTPHNWSGRQYASDLSTERVRKFRESKAKRSKETKRNVSETPPDTETDQKEIYNKPSSLDAEKEFYKNLNSVVGVVVDVQARRAVCADLQIGNADPLVDLFVAWDGSRADANGNPVRNPSGKFVRWATAAYRRASPEVRAACQPLDVEPDPLPPVQPSSSLLNSKLVKGPRRGR